MRVAGKERSMVGMKEWRMGKYSYRGIEEYNEGCKNESEIPDNSGQFKDKMYAA